MLARIIGMKLTEEQFEVQHAYDGEQAYEIIATDPQPDLVLLDVLIPKMSGFDVLEKLKAEGKHLPKVIVFSNFAQQADIEKAHELGAVDYIVKAAFSPAEILTRVREVLAGTPAADAPAEAAAPVATPTPAAPAPAEPSAYAAFPSMEDVMPMSEVLHPGESNNNP